MTQINKDVRSLGIPWEKSAAFSQAIKVGDTIYVAGQLGHDEKGDLVGMDFESQVRQTYANIQKLLSMYGASLENLVEEIVFVTNLVGSFESLGTIRNEVFQGMIPPTSTLVEVSRLALEEQLVEIRCTARV